MAKNILIFSDGTGQAGGLRPDQRLTNVYKLYRATRTGPDSPIDPAKQIAFYDPGLGSAELSGPFWTRPITWSRKWLSSGFGTGFTRNVADCYEAILRCYEPGDRIYLFGFSRGAYTVRSVAGVMNLCGVPVKGADGKPIPRYGKALRAIADEAVHTVYEHGAGRPREMFEDEREEQARRFRIKYNTEDDLVKNQRGNVVPYFIGVFDTVAALGSTGIKKAGIITLAVLGVLAGAALAGLLLRLFGLPFLTSAIAVVVVIVVVAAIYSCKPHIKVIRDFPKKGMLKWHWSAWRFKHYDRFLDRRVRYARHGQAIDERRATFARVEWGRTVDMKDAPDDWLVQLCSRAITQTSAAVIRKPNRVCPTLRFNGWSSRRRRFQTRSSLTRASSTYFLNLRACSTARFAVSLIYIPPGFRRVGEDHGTNRRGRIFRFLRATPPFSREFSFPPSENLA